MFDFFEKLVDACIGGARGVCASILEHEMEAVDWDALSRSAAGWQHAQVLASIAPILLMLGRTGAFAPPRRFAHRFYET